MEEIAKFYLEKIVINVDFFSIEPVNDKKLLYPPFYDLLEDCIAKYRESYPKQGVTFVETFRTNALQAIHFNNGASKIKKNGMHHYGIAADTIFIIDGKRSYKGDINLIREIYKEMDLTILGMWDPLHVQYIPVENQQNLRNEVSTLVRNFQAKYNLPLSGEVDESTILQASKVFG